jgi:diguanylate cyclase (GGDEF)-like protein/PAS domain S-box-containing protein
VVNRKILIVEDSKLNTRILKNSLSEYGYIIDSCTKGEDAIKKICEGLLPALILMDIELEGEKDGIDTAKEILKTKDIPILFLTSNTSREIFERIKEVKNYGFIPKGIDKYILLSSIESAIKLADANEEIKLYQDICEHTLDELYIINPDTLRIISANRAARKKLGYTNEEIQNMTLLDITNEFETYKKLISSLVKSEKKEVIFEGSNQKKDGSKYPVEIRLKINKYSGKKLIVASVRDLTESRKAEEERKKREENIKLMLEAIPSTAWLISREKKILLQNNAAKEIFRTKEGHYCWESIHKIEFLEDKYRKAYEKTGIPLQGTKCYFCRADEALEKGETINRELKLKDKTWDTWWVPLGDDRYLHYATDVTKYKEMEVKLEILSLTDPLTKAYNRRYMTEKLEEEIERAKRNNSTFSIIMVDIDHFKRINDNFGHNMGDLVLQKVTEMIKNRIRKIDVLARWGGEEFLILLLDTPVDKAVVLAEELRQKLSLMEIPKVQAVTASFGVAGYCLGDNIDTLVKRADDMMYKAKREGRNKVVSLSSFSCQGF